MNDASGPRLLMTTLFDVKEVDRIDDRYLEITILKTSCTSDVMGTPTSPGNVTVTYAAVVVPSGPPA